MEDNENGLNKMQEYKSSNGKQLFESGYEYVVRGAKVSCSQGTMSTAVQLPNDHGVYAADNRPFITQSDVRNDNIKGFGKCKSLRNEGGLCKPALCYWSTGTTNVKIKNSITKRDESLVGTDSIAICRCGGIVKIESSGQVSPSALVSGASNARKSIRYESQVTWQELSKDKKYEEIILKNKENILSAAKKYKIDPNILAACIYVEQDKNVDFKDYKIDYIAGGVGFDTSLGVSQIKLSTAKLVEDKGYIDIKDRDYEGFTDVNANDKTRLINRLYDDEINIVYAAAYLRYMLDVWEPLAPQVSSPELLSSLYNLGHVRRGDGPLGYIFGIGNKPRLPHENPEPSVFGNRVKENYNRMGELLE